MHDQRSSSTDPTPEMVRLFEQRTREHIMRVQNCLAKLAMVNPHYLNELIRRAREHDASKFSEEERIPYIWLTEYHRCRHSGQPFSYPPGMEEQVEAAIQHHMSVNRHHPEFHVDPNDMTEVDIIEMVCDWTAMAQEFGEPNGSARSWADKVIGHQLQFDVEQKIQAYSTIGLLDALAAEEPPEQILRQIRPIRPVQKRPMPMPLFLYHYSATVDHILTVQIIAYVFLKGNQPMSVKIGTVIGLFVYFGCMKFCSLHYGRRSALAVAHNPLTPAQIAIVVVSILTGAALSVFFLNP